MEEEKITQESIFVNEEDEKKKEKKLLKEAEESLKDKNLIPYGYIEVKLDSLGKLDAPSILHFRNYSMEEILELSPVIGNENKYLECLVKCLNKMVYEKFDCSLLHVNEMEEVMMYIFSTFWSRELEGHPYYKDESLPEDKINKKENILFTNIIISELGTKTLPKDFKEPIKININDDIVKFKLPRIKDTLIAKEYVNRKYFDEERELSDIKSAIEKKEKVSYEDKEKYDILQENKGKDFLKVYSASYLYGRNKKIFKSIDEKIEEFPNIPFKYWQEYEKLVREKCIFGIEQDYKFFSTEMKQEVTRRFRFQSMDFIPTMESKNDSNVVISFGD